MVSPICCVRTLPAESPDLNPIQHLWDELEQQLSYHSTSVLDLAYAFVAEWEQIPAARIQNLVESVCRRVAAADKCS